MPCDQIRTTSVDLSSIGKIDLNLLADALNSLGLTVSVYAKQKAIMGRGVTYQDGTLRLRDDARSITVDQVKQAYSVQVVKTTAKRFTWMLKETTKQQQQFRL